MLQLSVTHLGLDDVTANLTASVTVSKLHFICNNFEPNDPKAWRAPIRKAEDAGTDRNGTRSTQRRPEAEAMS